MNTGIDSQSRAMLHFEVLIDMPIFSDLNPDSGLSDVLKLFPRNSKRLLHLLNDIMCSKGELSRGEREAVAAFISEQNTTPYCVFYHRTFSEVFSGPVEATNQRIEPLLAFAYGLHCKDNEKIQAAHDEALRAGWSENAIYEVVEVCGIFDFINTIVLSSGITPPEDGLMPYPTPKGLENSYANMADEIGN